MKIFRDFVIVRVPSVFQDETRYKGLNGLQIMVNVFHDPQRHVRCSAEVMAVPQYLSRFPVISNPVGLPEYHDRRPRKPFLSMRDIEMDVRVGDRIYFHYNCLVPNNELRQWNHHFITRKSDIIGGQPVQMLYFKIKYDLIFAAVRYEPVSPGAPGFEWHREQDLKPMQTYESRQNDEDPLCSSQRFVLDDHVYRKSVDMIGGYVLVEPDMETWDDISIPIPEVVNGTVLLGPDGKPVMKPKSQWLVTKAQPEERDLQGWVRYVGKPMRGDTCLLETGDYVHFRPLADTKIVFEGQEYFRMRQRHIMLKVFHNPKTITQ